MRTFLAIALTTLLLATAVGAALAQPGSGPGATPEERRAKADALRAARNESLAWFHENRTDAIAQFHALNNETKRSFLENKTAVIQGCKAARNATADDNNSDFAQCVSDGLKPLITKAREEHRAHREAFIDRMTTARQAAIQYFLAQRQAIRGS